MESCESMLLSVENVHQKTPKELFDLSVQFAMAQAHSARSIAQNYIKPMMMNKKLGTTSLPAMEDCMELLDDSLRRLNDVVNPKMSSNSDDIRTWLSTAITNQETCLDGLESQKFSTYKHMMDSSSKNVSKFVSNSLALYKSVKTKGTGNSNPGGRKLLSDGFPTWVSAVERKLLEASTKDIEAKAVVAKDGTGTHKTIAEALAFVSLVGGGRTVIHVKAGTYNENLKIPSSQNNVMLVGDGKGITVITGSKNVEDGSSLLQTATFAATGDGFIARDITFVNSAGPAKHQAIALRVSSDKSVFYRCSIVGYQDSLYTLSNRQFYRETDIYGTVDFIFGNSAVVLQNCNIFSRKPMSQQKNFITAQGRTDPNQNTGISIHNCRITATEKTPTYLGRPWKAYSRTVIMESFLDNSIHPSGWFPWSGGSAPKTIYYGEYMNSGPGAATSGRVKWPGYHPSLTSEEATKFTVANLIAGGLWLPATGIAYDSGLKG
ncbi:Pectinesterase [Macleaya cordata]|uniref:Pectinesterase n=1 Tax=Macleaya cordata TaxID=56857 RepID=A0A200PZQ9_MACCD|nr:Pectinesterase [Macleaya cordata]